VSEGGSIGPLGMFCMRAIERAGLPFDMPFGPACKGLPLVMGITLIDTRGTL